MPLERHYLFMAIEMYQVHEAERREACHKAYITDDYFPVLEEKAKERGFRIATLSEINASATAKGVNAPDLYCWAGGLWARLEN